MIGRARQTSAPAPTLRLVSAARTHIGGRALNEDCLLDRPAVGLWAVADGMGGHEAGEVASALVVQRLGEAPPHPSGYVYLNAVIDALQAANSALVEQARARRLRGPIGSTVVALLIRDGHAACVWAGDSRAYLYRGGRVGRLTRDHSLVQALVDAGELAPGHSRDHPRANVVTRAVGAEEILKLDIEHTPVEAGDVLLLCSDGLTGSVDDHELADFLENTDPATAADRLLRLALARGAKDNVSLVVVRAEAG